MTQRERKLALGGLGALLLLGGVLVFHKSFWQPYQQTKQAIARLNNEIDDRDLEMRQRLADRRELNRLKTLSLPADPDPRRLPFEGAWNEYDRYLRELMNQSRLKTFNIVGTLPAPNKAPTSFRDKNKKPLAQTLAYKVNATGELTSVVALLDSFYQTPLLHQIKTVSIKPVKADPRQRAQPRLVDIAMSVEALLVDGAEKRSALLPGERRLLAVSALIAMRGGPSGLALVPLHVDSTLLKPRPLTPPSAPGQYAYISRKNIFFPTVPPTPPPEKPPNPFKDVNVNKHVRLTWIVRSDDQREAFFYSAWDNVFTRVRAKEIKALWARRQRVDPIYQNFPIWDKDGEKKTARVMRIDSRDIYFYYDETYYAIHIGEELAEAFDRGALSSKRIRELGMPLEPDQDKKEDNKEDE
jgi:hypothetical protein